jgi:uncharacterized phage protein (TIGR02220 family)
MSEPLSVGAVFNPYRMFVGAFIPNAIMEHPGLTSSAKLLWARLALFAGEKGYCWPSQETLADSIGVSVRTVRTILRELVEQGFIQARKPEGMDKVAHKTTVYEFLFHNCFMTIHTGKSSTSQPEISAASERQKLPVSYIRKDSGLKDSELPDGKESYLAAVTAKAISDLNARLGLLYTSLGMKQPRGFALDGAVRRKVSARLREGIQPEDFAQVNENMVSQWGRNPKMRAYLRPETLYGTKMRGYLNVMPSLSGQGIMSANGEESATVAKDWLEKGG